MRKEVKADEEVDLSFARDGLSGQFSFLWSWVQTQSARETGSERGGETC